MTIDFRWSGGGYFDGFIAVLPLCHLNVVGFSNYIHVLDTYEFTFCHYVGLIMASHLISDAYVS